jgi:hypothetical protein
MGGSHAELRERRQKPLHGVLCCDLCRTSGEILEIGHVSRCRLSHRLPLTTPILQPPPPPAVLIAVALIGSSWAEESAEQLGTVIGIDLGRGFLVRCSAQLDPRLNT